MNRFPFPCIETTLAPVSSYTLSLPFLAVVAVGHRVRLEYYRRDQGVLGTRLVRDDQCPVVMDLETGIRWQERVHSLLRSELDQAYVGRVSACVVETLKGGSSAPTTRLTIEPLEASGG